MCVCVRSVRSMYSDQSPRKYCEAEGKERNKLSGGKIKSGQNTQDKSRVAFSFRVALFRREARAFKQGENEINTFVAAFLFFFSLGYVFWAAAAVSVSVRALARMQ